MQLVASNFMKLQKTLFILFLIISKLNQAQTDFRPGYIIKLNGDTAYGQLDYRGDLLMGTICSFKSNSQPIAAQYTPNDIAEFRFDGSRYFISREVKSKRIFLEFLVKGKLNIYYWRDADIEHYYFEKDSTGIVELPYEEGILLSDDEKPYFHQSSKHIGILTYYLKDVPDLKTQIDEIKKPDHRNLIELSKDYQNKVCKNEKCIVYEKKTPIVSAQLEAVLGVVDYNLTENYFQLGMISHFWMPRVNEKLNFRTGILYSNFETDGYNYPVFKIPLQFEYIYPKGKIRPRTSFGINIYNSFYQTLAFMGGVNIRLVKSTFLSLNYDIDFERSDNFAFLPHSLFSQNVSCGVYFKI